MALARDGETNKSCDTCQRQGYPGLKMRPEVAGIAKENLVKNSNDNPNSDEKKNDIFNYILKFNKSLNPLTPEHLERTVVDRGGRNWIKHVKGGFIYTRSQRSQKAPTTATEESWGGSFLEG